MEKELYQEHELEAYLGEHAEDFDVDAIVGEATEIDHRTGNRYWREGIDLAEICARHDLANRVEYDGEAYQLVGEAVYGNVCIGGETCAGYEAIAVGADAAPDEEGYLKAYRAQWAVPQGIDETQDPADIIDWSEPDGLVDAGWYDTASGRTV